MTELTQAQRRSVVTLNDAINEAAVNGVLDMLIPRCTSRGSVYDVADTLTPLAMEYELAARDKLPVIPPGTKCFYCQHRGTNYPPVWKVELAHPGGSSKSLVEWSCSAHVQEGLCQNGALRAERHSY